MKGIRFLSIFFAIAAAPSFASAQAAGVTLNGHVSPLLKTSTKLNRSAPDESFRLSLVVNIDPNLLDQTLRQIYGPDQSAQRRYLTSSEFAEKFHLAEKRQALKDFAQANGFTVDSSDDQPTSLVVKVMGSVAQAEKAFGVQLFQYKASSGSIFRGHEGEPIIPKSLTPHLASVLGLSNAAGLRHPHLRRAGGAGPARPFALAGTGPGGGLAPVDVKAIYGLNAVALNGAGQKVALFELDGYNASDITAYTTQFGLPPLALTNVLVDGALNICGGGCVEVVLDIDMVAALAPNIGEILVYEGPNTGQGVIDTYARIAADNSASAVSTSWGITENLTTGAEMNAENAIFQQMAAQGQSIYAASGDSGAYGDSTHPALLVTDDPASQPFMTGVGGTSLSGALPAPAESTWATGGGGVSSVWPIPAYQVGVPGKASNAFRNVPDVSLDSDPASGYAIYNAGWGNWGGTSAAAPLWAALTALINQQRAANGQSRLGFANTTLYPLAMGGSYAATFNDVTIGNNGFYNAAAGYDNATGWGSFKGAGLIGALTVVLPPAIAQQPANLTVSLGKPGTFSIQATGVGLTYQWQKGVLGVFADILGATNTSYTFPPATAADNATQYRCNVTNSAGSTLSNAATLTVVKASDIDSILVYPNPWDVRKSAGRPMRFAGLPDGTTIKIFTLAGQLVRTLDANAGVAVWDMNNDSGRAVASGYYIYMVSDTQGNRATHKIAVIR